MASASRLAASGPTVRRHLRGACPATRSASAVSGMALPWPSASVTVKPGTRSGRVSSRSSICWATSGGMTRVRRTSGTRQLLVLAGCNHAKAAEENGQQDEGQGGRRNQPADDDNGQRTLHFGAGAAGKEHRDQAKGG